MPFELNDYKKFFYLPSEGAYLNCAAQGPICKPAKEAVLKGLQDKENPAVMDMNYSPPRVERCRQAVAKLISSKSSNIALANSTSWGVNVFARGLNLKAGDEVVFFEGQFPSNTTPWDLLKKNGVIIKRIPSPNYIVDLKDFENHLTTKTRVVSLEWVHFVSGDRIPLAEMTALCHKKNIFVAVDGTQGIATMPFSMSEMGVDALMCSAYKWLYSPYGSGFLALSDNLLNRLDITDVNWLSIKPEDSHNFSEYKVSFDDSATKFDVFSHMGYFNLDGMTASIEWLNTLDLAQNYKAVRQLGLQLREELDPKHFKPANTGSEERQSCIANFLCSHLNGDTLIQGLQKEGFTACMRGKGIRISPSIYNDSKQISQFSKLANKLADS